MSKIPNRFFYYWTGADFPFPFVLSARSIMQEESPESITLYYNSPSPLDFPESQEYRYWDYLKSIGVQIKEFDPLDFPLSFLSDEFYERMAEKIKESRTIRNTIYIVTDIARYLFLYVFGGIYYDLDTLTIKTLRPLLDECEVFLPTCEQRTFKITKTDQSFFANGNLGSVPHHAYYKDVLLRCQELLLNSSFIRGDSKTCGINPKIEVGCVTIDHVYKNNTNDPSIKVMPWQVFHSIGQKATLSEKVKYCYRDVFEKIFDLPPEAKILHFHTNKHRTRRRMKLYRNPQDVLNAKNKNVFAFYGSKCIDNHMMNFKW